MYVVVFVNYFTKGTRVCKTEILIRDLLLLECYKIIAGNII